MYNRMHRKQRYLPRQHRRHKHHADLVSNLFELRTKLVFNIYHKQIENFIQKNLK